MTESWGPADGNPYRAPGAGQLPNPYAPQPLVQPYDQPYDQPYSQPYTQTHSQPYPPYAPYAESPYGQPAYGQPPYATPHRSNGVAVAALVTGIVGSVLGLIPFVCVVGVVAGLVAVALGVAGLRRSGLQGGRGVAIGGLVAGVVAILVGGALTVVTVRLMEPDDTAYQQARDDWGEIFGPTDDPAAPEALPDTPTFPVLPLADVVSPAGATPSGGIPVSQAGVAGTTDGVAADAVVVEVYVDYWCPACGEFELSNGPVLDQLRLSGTVAVVYHPVSILDSSADPYSTRAATAVALVAHRSPEAFARYSSLLLSGQPTEAGFGLDDAELAAVAREAGVPEKVAVLIESGSYLEGADTMALWVTAATAVAEQDLGWLSTPTVLVDGVPLDASTYFWGDPQYLIQAVEDARG